MESEVLAISDWTNKSQELLNKTKNVFSKIGYVDSSFPTTVFDVEKPVSIVFVGQYSAGKSTIIKALTGIKDIETGEGIKTLVTQSYNWNGIEIVDTPGIHTKLRPDHDEISYKAISNADLLVYVVTEELFDDFIGNNFRKILLENDKAAEMILVVNKMADVGNTSEMRAIKTKDLEKVTAPYSPEDLRIVFIDAESYLDSFDEDDPEIASELLERSNFSSFIDTLNRFVAEKGISSRLTTVLYKLFDHLQKAIPNYQSSTGDEDIDAVEEHLLRERYIISQASWRIESAVRSIYERTASDIREKGRLIANDLFDCNDESQAEKMLKDAYDAVNDLSETCEKEVVAKIEELATDCQAQLDDFYNSDFSSALQFRLNQKSNKGNVIIDNLLKSDWIAQGSQTIITKTTGANAGANGLKAFSGSNVHEWVLNVGHYFGYSFKPWEAVKWVKRINIAGKALGVFGVVFSLGMQVKGDIDEDKRNKEIKENREKLRAGFNDAANELINHYNNAMNCLLDDNYRSRIREIDSKVRSIRELRTSNSEACRLLVKIQDECSDLISEIHRSTV